MPCRDCAQRPVIFLSYQQRGLCAKHFSEFFEKRVFRTIREFSMLKPNERVAIALSGGKDSTVCLYLMKKLSQKLPMKLSALLIDEGIVGYRPKLIQLAQKHCRKLGIPLSVVSIKKKTGKSLDQWLEKGKPSSAPSALPCSYCGVLRRYWLNRAARELKADKLVVGHNQDDVAQTLLMNLMKNESHLLARFGIVDNVVEDKRFIPRIKPLVRTPERETAAYALLNGIELKFQECPYAHSAFRQHVRDQLNATEEKYPGTKNALFESYLKLQPQLKLAERGKNPQLKTCPDCGEIASGKKCKYCELVGKR